MSVPLRILLGTNALPPRCGGKGWGTLDLAKGLASRGHQVEIVKIETGAPAGIIDGHYDALPVSTLRVKPPQLPVIKHLAGNEWLWRDLFSYLTETRLSRDRFDLLHAQDAMTAVPMIRAGRASGIPSVVSVRDHWPACYWSDLIYDPRAPRLCTACSAHMMTRCVGPRTGGSLPATWPLIPYMLSNLRTKRRTLAEASAVIAVSASLTRDLEARVSELENTSLFTIPDPVDTVTLDHAYESTRRPMAGPYLVFVGRLSLEKGAQFLLTAIEMARTPWPTVVIGDGPLRATLESEARTKGLDVRWLGRLDQSEVWAWMRHALVLAFPSYEPQALSRVLVEAAVLGVPIAAMATGGTADILRHGVTAVLSADVEGLGRSLGELSRDERLRHALGVAARNDVRSRFGVASVVDRIEAVYRQLLPSEAA